MIPVVSSAFLFNKALVQPSLSCVDCYVTIIMIYCRYECAVIFAAADPL